MEFMILLGQRKQSYPGQYAPESLAVMTDAEVSDNPDYLQVEQARFLASGEFSSMAVVTLEAETAAVMALLEPTAALKAEVVL